MKRFYNADIFLVILFAIASAVSLFYYPLSQFPLRVIPSLLLLFFLPGYALTAVLYPVKDSLGLIKRVLIGIVLSAALTFLFTLINLSGILNIPSITIFIILAVFTIIVAFIALRRRKNVKRYIKCKSCNGYYQLKEGESLEDFSKCNCGGELEYAAYDPVKKKTKFILSDVLVVNVLVFVTVTVLALPQLSNSGIRIVLVPVLLFFLSGYALTAAIYPYNSLSKLRRLLLNIVFSVVILFLSVFLMVYSFQAAPSNLFIFILSSLTVVLILIAFLRRFKSPKIYKEEERSGLQEFIKERKESEVRKSKSNFNEFISIKKEEFKKGRKSTYMDLILVFLVTIFSIISVAAPILNDSFVRTIFGLLFILFLPGYALIAALFPKIGDLDGIERVALSFGLSIAVAPLIGLALNYTPFGIKLAPILVSLSIFTISMLVVSFLRRKRIPEGDRFSVDFRGFFNSVKSSFSSENRTDKVLSIVLIASIVLAISMTGYVIASPKEGEKFTEFYILGPNGKASDYPTNLTAGETGSVTVGVVNHEYATINYKLMIKLNNKTLNEENITLANNEKFEKTFNFTAGTGQKQKLEFLLYKLPDENNVYRSLHLWINV